MLMAAQIRCIAAQEAGTWTCHCLSVECSTPVGSCAGPGRLSACPRAWCLTHSAALCCSRHHALPFLCPGLKAANRVNLVKGSTLSSTLGSVSRSVGAAQQ
jgi:hypothetical protein